MNKNVKILAIDIGGSKILSAVVKIEYGKDKKRVSLAGVSKRFFMNEFGKREVKIAVSNIIQETLKKTGENWDSIRSIGITIPGVAAPKLGCWVYSPFSGICNFPIVKELQDLYHCPVFCDNDVNACAWGEKVFGICQNVDNYVWITISNGIGGGLVLNGQVYPGKFLGAAEIGHLNVIENGELCGCGNRGCLEAVAAGPAIALKYHKMIARYVARRNIDSTLYTAWLKYLKAEMCNKSEYFSTNENLTATTIADEARRNNPLSRLVYHEVGHHIGRAISWITNLVNPEKIVIGGGVVGAFELFYPSLLETFQKYLFKQTNKKVIIERTGLGYEAGLLGAAALAFNNPYISG